MNHGADAYFELYIDAAEYIFLAYLLQGATTSQGKEPSPRYVALRDILYCCIVLYCTQSQAPS